MVIGPHHAAVTHAGGSSEVGQRERMVRLGMAGLAINPVQGFRTLRDLHWEFLRLWTGFELSSSWLNLPCYGPNRNRNILDFMSWPQIDLGATGSQRHPTAKIISKQ
jgi:hypothetical protein